VRVSEVADNCPVLIGYIPLELLDFVVSSKEQKLIGNPDHGGQYMIDLYCDDRPMTLGVQFGVSAGQSEAGG
jgi:hypothetical protein